VLCIDRESGNLYKCVSADYCKKVFSWKIVGEVSEDVIRQSVSDYLANNPVNGGLSATEKDMILTLFRGAVYQSELAEETVEAFSKLQSLWSVTVNPDTTPDVSMTGISAVYSGGDMAVGTAVANLTGIVVTAHYSDGSSETVTGYTLSGTIAEGSNTVTVSYQGKTTTFTVTGVAEESEPAEVAMTQGLYSWNDRTEYADGGNMEYTGAMPSIVGATAWYSDVFEKDTTVTISVLYGMTNANLRQYAACVSDVTTNVNGYTIPAGDMHYMEQIGTASTAEYTVQYTVRAGYRLAVINYNSGKPTSITVTK